MADLILIAVLVVVATLILKNTIFSSVSTVDVEKEIDESGKTQDEADEPTVIQDYTPRMLSNYNGFDLEKIFIAIKGNVYDVSSGRRFYGPSGPYSNFAGHDASRGLAKNSFEMDVIKPFDEPIDDLADLTANDLTSLKNWENMFKGKYPVVGRLVSEEEWKKSEHKGRVSD
ncbi:DEKNAAC102266 [Brettanomyces naardenensis]|uniref:DEKNAAC102266 n=1 Tax=Brettanomyces naardenensis TaxID=13370 RepID=A0A448YLG2_BRENA|nr:DEKNAAC102266 [Brettanomyces naardenensis]